MTKFNSTNVTPRGDPFLYFCRNKCLNGIISACDVILIDPSIHNNGSPTLKILLHTDVEFGKKGSQARHSFTVAVKQVDKNDQLLMFVLFMILYKACFTPEKHSKVVHLLHTLKLQQ